jgi:hypothetical protein
MREKPRMSGALRQAVGYAGKTADFSTPRLWRSGRNDPPVEVVPRFGGHDDFWSLAFSVPTQAELGWGTLFLSSFWELQVPFCFAQGRLSAAVLRTFGRDDNIF